MAYGDDDHDELVGHFTMILDEAIRRGASRRQMLVLVECCLTAACVQTVNVGDEDLVLHLLTGRVKKRFTASHLADLAPAGHG